MTVFTKRRLATAAAFAVSVAAGLPLAWGFIPNTQDATGIFELDGDALQEGTASPITADDWSNILSLPGYLGVPNAGKSTVDPTIASLAGTTQCVGLTCNSPNFPGVLFRGTSNTIFSGGSTKDPSDLSSWLWKTGNVQPKDNIQDAYAAAYVLNENVSGGNLAGDLLLVFGLDHISNNGDAFLGFWFFQSCVDTNGPAGSGSTTHFGDCHGGTAKHTPGDVLVLMNFPQGSPQSPTVGVWQWVTMGGDVSPNLKTIIPLSTDQCDGPAAGTPPPGTDQPACGITNVGTGLVQSPWPFQSVVTKVPANQFPQESFFEGVINLSRIFRLPNVVGSVGCLSSFLAETRASTSPSSTLSAFVLGKFTLCGMTASKTCGTGMVDNVTNMVDYSYTFQVSNTGIATLYNVTAVDDIDGATFTIGTLTKKGSPGATFSSPTEQIVSTSTPRVHEHTYIYGQHRRRQFGGEHHGIGEFKMHAAGN
jgi:hypothetical protein